MKHRVDSVETYLGYFVAVIDGAFCLRMGAVRRPEPRFCRHT